MTTTSRAAQCSPGPSDAAAALRSAPLARLLVRRDGDAIAAAGVLARGLQAMDVPVQAAATDSRAAREQRVTDGDPDAVTVSIGAAADADVTLGTDGPAAAAAAAIVRALDVAPAYELALAGVVAAGELPADATPELLEAAREAGIERRPGVGLATDDLADGLAGSTLFHAPFSGDPDAAAAALADAGVDVTSDPDTESSDDVASAPDGESSDDADESGDGDNGSAEGDAESDAASTEERRRTVASLVALAATDGPAPERAATTVVCALRPLAGDGPAPTVEGYADVLDVVAAVDPGLALAHALGDCELETARSTWRAASAAAHAAIDAADPARYDGVVVLDAGDADPAIVARMARDYLAPEPVTVAIGDDAVGVATTEPDAPGLVDAVAATTEGAADAAPRRGVVRDVGTANETDEDDEPVEIDETAVVDALREHAEGSP